MSSIACNRTCRLGRIFVDRNREAGCMHHAGWYGVLRDAFWVTPFFLMAINEQGAVEGILPAYFSGGGLTGRHISSFEGSVADFYDCGGARAIDEARWGSETGPGWRRYLRISSVVVDEPAGGVGRTVRASTSNSAIN